VRESKKWDVKESRDLKIQQNDYLTTPQRKCSPSIPIPTLLNPISNRLKIHEKTCRRIPNVSPFLGTRWGYNDTPFSSHQATRDVRGTLLAFPSLPEGGEAPEKGQSCARYENLKRFS
jgi:hypothetical protein